MLYIASALLALAGANATAAADIEEPDPKAMSQAEIRTFNAGLEKNHRFFIRCKKSAATGSLIERTVTCRTNQQWAASDARGNDEARDVAERMSGKAVNSN